MNLKFVGEWLGEFQDQSINGIKEYQIKIIFKN